jgi:ribosomal protein S18 acetylase RimI-like enzyme
VTAIEVHAATAERWADIAAVAGEQGFYSGCWCTWWQTTSKEWDELGGRRRRERLRKTVAAGEVPGLLAYRDGEPVGWVRVGPRDDHPRMQRSPKLKAVDGEPAWVVSCFVVRRDARRQGVAAALLDAAVRHARAHGARVVDGVPVDVRGRGTRSADLFTGTTGMFESAGFVEIARRGGRPVLRRSV